LPFDVATDYLEDVSETLERLKSTKADRADKTKEPREGYITCRNCPISKLLRA